jgi:hypothetical protein
MEVMSVEEKCLSTSRRTPIGLPTFVRVQCGQSAREEVQRGSSSGGGGEHDEPDVLEEEGLRDCFGEPVEEG